MFTVKIKFEGQEEVVVNNFETERSAQAFHKKAQNGFGMHNVRLYKSDDEPFKESSEIIDELEYKDNVVDVEVEEMTYTDFNEVLENYWLEFSPLAQEVKKEEAESEQQYVSDELVKSLIWEVFEIKEARK